MKRAEKGFLRLWSGRKKGAFFGKEYSVKCTGKSNAEKKDGKGLIEKINANNLYQRKLYYETPMYDHVLGDKPDSDKDKV
jgi:hypothetical protein